MEAPFEAMSELIKVLSNPIRLQILMLLERSDNKCVKEIASEIHQKASTTSFQLKKLKMSHLIEKQHEHTRTYYRINKQYEKEIALCISSLAQICER